MPHRKLKLLDRVAVTFTDENGEESVVRGEVMHVGRDRDIMVIRNTKTDEDYQVQIEKISRIQKWTGE